MAYRPRRRSTRSRSGYARGRSYSARRGRRVTSRRRSRVSRGGNRTIRIVVQTVPGAGPAADGRAAALPMRAMF